MRQKRKRSDRRPPFIAKKRGAPRRSSLRSIKCQFTFLLGWRRGRGSADIDVNSRRAAAKQPSSENISRSQNHNHENNQHGNDTGAATTISIVSHETPPPICRGIGLDELEGPARLLSQGRTSVNERIAQVICWDRGRLRPQMSAKRENFFSSPNLARLRRVAGGTPAVPANHLSGLTNKKRQERILSPSG